MRCDEPYAPPALGKNSIGKNGKRAAGSQSSTRCSTGQNEQDILSLAKAFGLVKHESPAPKVSMPSRSRPVFAPEGEGYQLSKRDKKRKATLAAQAEKKRKATLAAQAEKKRRQKNARAAAKRKLQRSIAKTRQVARARRIDNDRKKLEKAMKSTSKFPSLGEGSSVQVLSWHERIQATRKADAKALAEKKEAQAKELAEKQEAEKKAFLEKQEAEAKALAEKHEAEAKELMEQEKRNREAYVKRFAPFKGMKMMQRKQTEKDLFLATPSKKKGSKRVSKRRKPTAEELALSASLFG